MKLASLAALIPVAYKAIVAAVKFCKRVAPVLAVLAVLLTKLSIGDFTGLPELFSALVAAAAAVWNGQQVANLTKAVAEAKASA